MALEKVHARSPRVVSLPSKGLVATTPRFFHGMRAVSNVLSPLRNRWGTIDVTYSAAQPSQSHMVAIHRTAEDLGFFNPNFGVFLFDSYDDLAKVFYRQVPVEFCQFRENMPWLKIVAIKLKKENKGS